MFQKWTELRKEIDYVMRNVSDLRTHSISVQEENLANRNQIGVILQYNNKNRSIEY